MFYDRTVSGLDRELVLTRLIAAPRRNLYRAGPSRNC